MIIFFLSVLVAFLIVVNILGSTLSGPRYSGPVSDHFNGHRFVNPGGIQAKGLMDALKWFSTRKKIAWRELENAPFGEKPETQIEKGVKITFVNHSTFLIQTEGLNILTDPIWSERASPFSFMGPKRMRPPGLDLNDLPPIHVVLISHNHYDHLDIDTLKKIVKAHRPKIFTPLGVKAFLDKKGIAVTKDMDWWNEYSLNDRLKIIATPAQHFSSRGTNDRDGSLWCGYMIKRNEGNIYFVGDTGYNDAIFKNIGEKFSPIQLAMIPIGAYKPQWFMSPIHCSPEEAVRIHLELRSKKSIAAHFGTFPLADEGQEQPLQDLKQALMQNNLGTEDFIALKEGQGRLFL